MSRRNNKSVSSDTLGDIYFFFSKCAKKDERVPSMV